MARILYTQLRLSEHDDWRHKHRQAITSAYGALHSALVKCAGLEHLADWIRLHPEAPLPARRPSEVPGNLSALELLFLYGPETIFHLL